MNVPHDQSPKESAPERNRSRPGTPGWVKVFGIITVVVLLLLVVLWVVGGGQHGPGRHGLPEADAGRLAAVVAPADPARHLS